MAPIIALTPLIDTKKDSLWMLPGYMDGISQAGGIPVMLPLTCEKTVISKLLSNLDGIILTGGHDVSPSLYNEEALPSCGECIPARDVMEELLLKEALKLDKPVLGICRGAQFMCVSLGGTLYQDLPTQRPSDIIHRQTPPYDAPVHSVSINKSSPLYEILKTDTLMVNSYHHQGIKTLPQSLTPMAYSPDGLTEAVYMREKRFVMGVQWHPEFSYKTDESSRKIFEAFVRACT